MSPRLRIVLALAAVYVIWGSTYFAMGVALRYLPPFAMGASRFLSAGIVLVVALRLSGAPFPTGRQWASAALVGTLLLGCGNGLVAVAQRTVDSGVAATVVATMPLWTAIIGSAFGDRPTWREFLGLMAGFAGVAILHRGGSLSASTVDTVALVVAPMAWATGSLLSRRLSMAPGLMGAGAQMILGGLVMMVVSLAFGERPHGSPTLATVGALVYLTVFGSMVAFSAYGYLLKHTRPAIATSYAYVNPMVALGLGAVLGNETFTATKAVACGLTLGGVLLVSRFKR